MNPIPSAPPVPSSQPTPEAVTADSVSQPPLETTASTPSTAGEPAPSDQPAPVMSKSALKRQRKEEAFQAMKLQRRAHEKEKRKAKSSEVRRMVAEGLMEKPPSKKKKGVGKQTPHGARIVIDMGFDDLMTDKEVKSMASQLAYCYSANRSTKRPFPLLISSFNGRLRESFERRKDWASWKGVEWWEEGLEVLYEGARADLTTVAKAGANQELLTSTPSAVPTEPDDALPVTAVRPNVEVSANLETPSPEYASSPAPTVAMGVFRGQPRSTAPQSSIVYLTGDSPNVLSSLEPGTTYVLGGIVDRNRYKLLCLNKAEKLGIRHAQLPIGEHLPEMQTRKVLTVNQVYEILVNYVANPNGGWREALRKTMPERKFDPDGRKKRREGKEGQHDAAPDASEAMEDDDGVYVAQEEEEDDEAAAEGLKPSEEAPTDEARREEPDAPVLP
ncbi:hypothetical protein JCM11641_003124 [Rhodosporidiobolus odoratus]